MSGSMMSVKRGLQSVACSPLAEIAVLPRLGNWVRGRPTVCFTGASAKVVRRGAVSISPTGTRCASSSTSSSSSGEEVPRAEATDDLARRLIMYSKPGCCLCDGLKEKLTTLPNIQLEVLHCHTPDIHSLVIDLFFPIFSSYIRFTLSTTCAMTEEIIVALASSLSIHEDP